MLFAPFSLILQELDSILGLCSLNEEFIFAGTARKERIFIIITNGIETRREK